MQERDPTGANTGAEDPYEQFDNDPSYLDIVPQEQSLYLDGGYDPFNPGGCELDGMPYDCEQLKQRADNGSVGADVFRDGRLIGHVSLTGGLVVGRGYVTVDLPDIYYDVMHDFGGEDGIQPLPTTQSGGVYFVEVAVNQDSRGGQPPIRHPDRGKKRPRFDCEKFLAQLFTGVSDTTFSDVTDGDPIDTLTGTNEDPANGIRAVGYMQTHNHGYNPVSDPARATQIFAPAGGVILGGLRETSRETGYQNYVTVFYPSLGGQANIVLQFFHVENFTGGTVQNDGRILLGTMGEDGIWTGYPGGKKGYHYHINAWKWWGKLDRKGNPIGGNAGTLVPDALPIKAGGFRSPANTFNLSNLCPR